MKAISNRIKAIDQALSKQQPERLTVHLSWVDPDYPGVKPLTEAELQGKALIQLTWGDENE